MRAVCVKGHIWTMSQPTQPVFGGIVQSAYVKTTLDEEQIWRPAIPTVCDVKLLLN